MSLQPNIRVDDRTEGVIDDIFTCLTKHGYRLREGQNGRALSFSLRNEVLPVVELEALMPDRERPAMIQFSQDHRIDAMLHDLKMVLSQNQYSLRPAEWHGQRILVLCKVKDGRTTPVARIGLIEPGSHCEYLGVNGVEKPGPTTRRIN